MRRIQGGNKIFGKCWVVLVAVTGMLCVMLSDASMRALGDDSFVTASDSVDSSGNSAHLDWKNPTQTRQVDFVDAEQIPVPPPPAGQDYDDSSVRLQPLSPAIAPDSGHVLDSGDLSGDWASGDCASGNCASGDCDGGDSCGCAADLGTCDSCGGCGPCPCGPPGRFWVRGEYLLWWTKGMRTPPLVTTSPFGTDRQDAGVLGEYGTQILFGGNDLLEDSRSGGRIRFGLWLDCCNTYGIEADFFALDDERQSFSAESFNGSPILARPFFNAVTNTEDAELVGFPQILDGRVGVEAESSLSSAGIRWRCNLCCTERECAPPCHLPNCDLCYAPGGDIRLDFLVGYRYMRLDESLLITEDLDAFSVGTQFDIFDNFDTETQFHGVDIGFIYEYHRCRWSLDLLGKIAFGNNNQQVSIDGGTTISAGGISDEFTGGLLAQRTNIGNFERDKFAVIPEFGATLGYRLTDNIKLTMGYSLVYWNNVARPGNIIDRTVNPNLLPPEAVPFSGPLRPAFAFNDTDFWAQGLSWGAELRW